MITLEPSPLTRAAFLPYGDVIEASSLTQVPMNDGRFRRFAALAPIDTVAPGQISIVRAVVATTLPYRFDGVERHPQSTQAFIPRRDFGFVVVVAPPGAAPEPASLAAFYSSGSQGISYHRGTWHMPLIALEPDEEFLVIDSGHKQHTEIHRFGAPVTLLEPRG